MGDHSGVIGWLCDSLGVCVVFVLGLRKRKATTWLAGNGCVVYSVLSAIRAQWVRCHVLGWFHCIDRCHVGANAAMAA
ncbi:hypothetical protein D3C72_2268240 [compost metagenome]